MSIEQRSCAAAGTPGNGAIGVVYDRIRSKHKTSGTRSAARQRLGGRRRYR